MVDDLTNEETLTIPRPLGGEVYQELLDTNGKLVVLTYNDLWLMIVCRASLDGDWLRTREATGLVPDPARKRAMVERLWKLEQALDGLPPIPEETFKLNLHRAHLWFNQRTVSDASNW